MNIGQAESERKRQLDEPLWWFAVIFAFAVWMWLSLAHVAHTHTLISFSSIAIWFYKLLLLLCITTHFSLDVFILLLLWFSCARPEHRGARYAARRRRRTYLMYGFRRSGAACATSGSSRMIFLWSEICFAASTTCLNVQQTHTQTHIHAKSGP